MDGNIKIESDGTGGKVMLDGADISNMLIGVDIHMRGGEVPQIKFELSNLETMVYEVKHDIGRSDSLVTAVVAILRAELLKHGDIYNGFLASINSAIKECGGTVLPFVPDEGDMAEHIMKRIIGEE